MASTKRTLLTPEAIEATKNLLRGCEGRIADSRVEAQVRARGLSIGRMTVATIRKEIGFAPHRGNGRGTRVPAEVIDRVTAIYREHAGKITVPAVVARLRADGFRVGAGTVAGVRASLGYKPMPLGGAGHTRNPKPLASQPQPQAQSLNQAFAEVMAKLKEIGVTELHFKDGALTVTRVETIRL